MKKDPNYMDRLVAYCKRNLEKGYDKESLKWALVNQGQSRLEIEKALKIAEQQIAKQDSRMQRQLQQSMPAVQQEPLTVEPEPKPSFWKRWFGAN